jgi:N-acetylglucosamine kinase
MSCILGIDGGGTRTTAWLAAERGKILARSLSGPSNPLKVGFEASQREILRAAKLAMRKARLPLSVAALSERRKKTTVAARRKSSAARTPPLQLAAVVVGLAGVDRPPVYRKLFNWLRKAIPARRHQLTSDAAIAMRAAIGDSPGIIVISGTGSIAYGRDDRGHVLRSGGWGTLFDDAGSGYDLGRKAIVAALHDFDGRGPFTQLAARLRKTLRIPDMTRVVLLPLTPQKIAGLFPLVLESARRRDFVAQKLCDEAGRDLADLAVALLRRWGWLHRTVPVVCAGGVFRASPRIRRSFAYHLHRRAPNARIHLHRQPPVLGALALARELATSQAEA